MTLSAPPARSHAPAVAGDRLQWMATFVRIVESGSLSAAASQLQATQPTISRRLQALESWLGARLLQRSTHVMRLTPEGERCFERAKALLADWAAFEADLRGSEQELEGSLRIAVPHAFGQEKLVAPLAEFLRQHPRLSVEWLLQDETRDFIGSGIDCAIQVGLPSDPGVVAIKVGEVPRIVVAAPSLFAGKALPEQIEDLAALPWLALRTYYRNELTLRHGQSGETRRFAIHPRISTDSLYALRSACVLGLGVGIGSAWLLADDLAQGRLLHLVPCWTAAALPVYLCYPQADFRPTRLQHFIAAMRQAVPAVIAG